MFDFLRSIVVCTIVVLVLFGGYAPLNLIGERTETPVLSSMYKNMTFFLHSVNSSETSKPIPGGGSTLTYFDTTLDWNSENVTYNVSGTKIDFEWYLVPSLADDFTINMYSFKIWARFVSGSTNNAQISITISELNDTGAETWSASQNYGSVPFTTTPELKDFSYTFPSHTFNESSTIKVRFSVTAGSDKIFEFYYDTAQVNSRIDFRSLDSFRILSVSTLDWQDTEIINFDFLKENKTMKIRARLGDPFGGYDIRWVNLTLFDPSGSIVLDNETMTKINGTPISYLNEYEKIWNYSNYSSGRYNLTVWAVDNNGHNWYYQFAQFTFYPYYETYHSYFYIGGLPSYVWIKAIDDMSFPLSGARVIAKFGGTSLAYNYTDTTGKTNITVYPGTYKFEVEWQDIIVAVQTENITLNISEKSPVIINSSVFYPTFQTIDDAGIPLSTSAIYITHPNGTKLSAIMTNSTGFVTLLQSPKGEYDIEVKWRGIVVHTGIKHVNSTEIYIIPCSVYYITFKAVDENNVPLSNIGITVYHNATRYVMDFRITNSTGEAIVRVPYGIIDVEAYWQNLLVNTTGNLNVTGNAYIILKYWFFKVFLNVIDSYNFPVENANIIIRIVTGEGVIDSLTTNSSGVAISRLPPGTYYVETYWYGTMVNATYITVTGNISVSVIAQEIYFLTVHVVDSNNISVSGAEVVVTIVEPYMILDVALTGDDGDVTLRVPKGAIDITVYWYDTLANVTRDYSVSNDSYLTISSEIYYLTLKAMDSHGAIVSDAQVITYNEKITDSKVTDQSGQATSRLPREIYNIKVYWRNVLVYEDSIYITNDSIQTIKCNVYYLTVKSVDSNNAPIINAFVIVSSSSGFVSDANFTDKNGVAVFKLPTGTYTTSIYYKTVYYLTKIDEKRTETVYINQSDKVTIFTFSNLPIPITRTALFYSLLGMSLIGISFALVLFWTILRLRKKKE